MTKAFLTLFVLLAALPAQERTGRHYHRESRLPTTAATAPVAEASAGKVERKVAPLGRLRSGRAWPRFHFTRLPATPAAGAVPVEASAGQTTRKRGFWRARR